jgi:hypothetical protein
VEGIVPDLRAVGVHAAPTSAILDACGILWHVRGGPLTVSEETRRALLQPGVQLMKLVYSLILVLPGLLMTTLGCEAPMLENRGTQANTWATPSTSTT